MKHNTMTTGLKRLLEKEETGGINAVVADKGLDWSCRGDYLRRRWWVLEGGCAGELRFRVRVRVGIRVGNMCCGCALDQLSS